MTSYVLNIKLSSHASEKKLSKKVLLIRYVSPKYLLFECWVKRKIPPSRSAQHFGARLCLPVRMTIATSFPRDWHGVSESVALPLFWFVYFDYPLSTHVGTVPWSAECRWNDHSRLKGKNMFAQLSDRQLHRMTRVRRISITFLSVCLSAVSIIVLRPPFYFPAKTAVGVCFEYKLEPCYDARGLLNSCCCCFFCFSSM